MSRDEWVTLPDGTRLHRSLDGRQYFPSSDGTVMLSSPGFNGLFNVALPLAEFEALLFGQPERDAYTRAAVRYAEAAMRYAESDDMDSGPHHDEMVKADAAFLPLYREKHGG